MTTDYEEKMLHVQLWAESGMSKRAYARENGINRNTFYGWCSKAEAWAKPEEHLLVELNAEDKRNETIKKSAGNLHLQTPNGYLLYITGSLDKDLLQDLLDALEAR